VTARDTCAGCGIDVGVMPREDGRVLCGPCAACSTCPECGLQAELTTLRDWLDPMDPEEFGLDPDHAVCDGCGEDTRDSVSAVCGW